MYNAITSFINILCIQNVIRLTVNNCLQTPKYQLCSRKRSVLGLAKEKKLKNQSRLVEVKLLRAWVRCMQVNSDASAYSYWNSARVFYLLRAHFSRREMEYFILRANCNWKLNGKHGKRKVLVIDKQRTITTQIMNAINIMNVIRKFTC